MALDFFIGSWYVLYPNSHSSIFFCWCRACFLRFVLPSHRRVNILFLLPPRTPAIAEASRANPEPFPLVNLLVIEKARPETQSLLTTISATQNATRSCLICCHSPSILSLSIYWFFQHKPADTRSALGSTTRTGTSFFFAKTCHRVTLARP